VKKAAIIFPKDSEAVFNRNSNNTFGGATAQLYNIAKALQCMDDIEVFSLISDYPFINFDESSKFMFIKTFKNSDNPIKKFLVYHRELQKLKPDAIIQRGLTLFSALLALYCKWFKIKFIYMFAHDNEIRGRYQKNNKRCTLFKMMLNNSTELITQSSFQKNELLTTYKKSSTIIKSGYNIEPYTIDTKEYILWVSRLESWKQPEIFIELAEKYPDLNFLMIAPVISTQREYGETIIRRTSGITNLSHIPFVHFNEINLYYKKAILFVNTSSAEGFPNTFIQACKNGIPLLSYNVNPDNFIDEYNCGYFCNNDKDLLSKYLELLVNNKKEYNSKSLNAYSYAAEFHDIKKNIESLANIIREEINAD
jgi:glycosyltransferase involved in cell wall biosynthesis